MLNLVKSVRSGVPFSVLTHNRSSGWASLHYSIHQLDSLLAAAMATRPSLATAEYKAPRLIPDAKRVRKTDRQIDRQPDTHTASK